APMFDARELDRWGLPSRNLPRGSIVLYRSPGLVEQHGRAIALGLGIIVLEAVLVAGLVLQLRRRRRVERPMAEADTRCRPVADFTHDWAFWRRPDGPFEYMSPSCEQVSGHPAWSFLEDPGLLEKLIHEDDVAAWNARREAPPSGPDSPPLEFRLRR